jgi:26S proteasome regulatory subunit N5
MAGSGVETETVKMEVDYSAEVERLIPECETVAMEGRLSEALDKLLLMEKQTRTAGDANSTGMILVCIMEICFQAQNWPLLTEHIVMMTKRRGQLIQAVTKMIQQACTYVEKTADLETKLKLIDTLRTVTEGKIYVEVERARLTRRLAQIEEEQGNISKAAKILQDQQVETFGSMEKREKVEFILEQMRLCLANHDYVRTQIISKKISVRFFDGDGVEDLKLKYYQLMIALGEHEDAYLTISRHYQAVLDTPLVKEDPVKRQEALRNVVLYLLLAPYDNEQNDLVHRVSENKTLEEIPTYQY